MTREEIINKINWVKDEIMYEECADLHYNFARVRELEKELAELKAELAKLN